MWKYYDKEDTMYSCNFYDQCICSASPWNNIYFTNKCLSKLDVKNDMKGNQIGFPKFPCINKQNWYSIYQKKNSFVFWINLLQNPHQIWRIAMAWFFFLHWLCCCSFWQNDCRSCVFVGNKSNLIWELLHK